MAFTPWLDDVMVQQTHLFQIISMFNLLYNLGLSIKSQNNIAFLIYENN